MIQSIDRILALLEPTDRIGVVGFANNAYEVAPLAAADGAARRLVSSRVHRLCAEGGTNIEAGLTRAAAMMPPRGDARAPGDPAPQRRRAQRRPRERRRPRRARALVPARRRRLHARLRPPAPEDLLQAISDAAAGRYHFIADPKVCEMEFAQAIGAQGDVVAEDVELALLPERGVEIARFLGKPEVRFGAGGLRIGVPDLLEGSRFLVVAEARRDPAPRGRPVEPAPRLRSATAARASGSGSSSRRRLAVDVGDAGVGHPTAAPSRPRAR